ncbi:MAG: hypothetical protein JWO80_1411 [Bryobacterales bacterium]|nr:hypothetical protein [Bryobacterales bacterium]
MTKGYNLLLSAAVLVFVCASVAIMLVKAPWWDEGLFASPAYNLLHHGVMGSTVWVSQSHFDPLPGIDKHVYTWMPLYPLFLASWMKLLSYSLISMRLGSLLWGTVVLSAWYGIMWALTKRPEVAALTVVLIATDYSFITTAATARYDMMTGALGFGGMAVYLLWRNSNFKYAVLAASTLEAASLFTHPLGILHVLAFGFLTLYFDWRRIRLSSVLLGALPFLAFGAAWTFYILQAPGDFYGQFFNHTAHRTEALRSPYLSIAGDFSQRYLVFFFTGLHDWQRIKGLTLLLLFSGFVGVLLTPHLRKTSAGHLLLFLSVCYYAGIALLDTLKSPHYFVHLFPLLLALTALWLADLWLTRSRMRVPAVAAVACLVIVQLGGAIWRSRSNSWRTVYNPLIAYVQEHSRPDSLIIGPAELTFGLGPEANLKDDPQLGFGTDWNPDLIVKNEFYDFNFFATHNVPASAFVINRLVNEFEPVYRLDKYTVYARRIPRVPRQVVVY